MIPRGPAQPGFGPLRRRLATAVAWLAAAAIDLLDALLPRCTRRRQAFRALVKRIAGRRRGDGPRAPARGAAIPVSDLGSSRGERRLRRVSALVVVHHVPEPDRDAGSLCTVHYLESFVRLGVNVTLLGDDFACREPEASRLRALGVEVMCGAWHSFDARAWLAANGRRFDVVLVNRPEIARRLYPRLRAACPAAEFWYFGVDLHFLRERRRAIATGSVGARWRSRRWAAIEGALVSAFDRVLTISREEADVIERELGRPGAVVFPGYQFAEDDGERDWGGAGDLLFVGGFDHPPNVDGAVWFVREILPRTSGRTADAPLHVVGARAPRVVRALASDRVVIHGGVSRDRLLELYRRTRVAVVPLRFGAGLKGKVLEAFAHGVPVVSTACGLEGVHADEVGLVAADDPQEFARRVDDLYGDERASRDVVSRQRRVIAEHFSPAAADRVFSDLFAAVR